MSPSNQHAAAAGSKKRKRAEESSQGAPSASGLVNLHVNSEEAAGHPVLACAGALSVPSDAHFELYGENGKTDSSFIFGETKKQEWESKNLVLPKTLEQGQRPDDARGYNSQYMLAVYNKATQTAQLVPAPVHIVAPTLKRLKHLNTVSQPADAESRMVQRNALGTAFGSKKAKANIRAAERSKIDVGSADLQAYQPELQANLDDVLGKLPDAEDLAAMTASAGLIPKPNPDAEVPSEAYPIENIVSRAELSAMPIKDAMQAATLSERMQKMPTRSSAFVAKHLKRLVNQAASGSWDKPAKEKLRMLVYLSALLAFKRGGQRKSLDDLRAKFELPDVVLEGLMERFTEQRKGSKAGTSTTATETKLLAYTCALSLHISNYSADMAPLASDLSLPVPKLQDLFKSLGCTIVYPTKEEKDRYAAEGMSAKDIKDLKKAAIKLPLTFPKPKRGRKQA